MAEKDSTLDWTGTDKSDHMLTPEAELIPEGRAQGSRLPTSVQHDFIDATPSGEVQMRVKMRDERQVMGNIRPNKNADNLILMEEPINGGAASGDGTAAGSVTRECTVNQQVSHGRGDKFSGYFADSSVQDRFGDQRFSHQRENFSSPVFIKGQVPMDVEGARKQCTCVWIICSINLFNMATHVIVLLFAETFVIVALAKSENIDLYSEILQIHKTMKAQRTEMEAQGIEISFLKDTIKNQQTEIERLNAIITNMQTVNKEMNNGAVQTNHDNTSYDNGSKPELHVQSLPPWEEKHHDEIEEDQPRALESIPQGRLHISKLQLYLRVNCKPTSSNKYISTTTAVAFYAQLSTSETNVGKHHPIVFDHVTLNVGNGYNKHTGAFTAPVGGIYVFTFTLFPNRGNYMAVNIFKNSEVISQIYTQIRTDMFSAKTPVAVIDMNVGDTAFVRTSSTNPSNGDVYSDVNVKSSFAGWKIAGS
ncbi:Hypothetical predicted protein [Mytilus galloprovincialis]|uniref:C1q domain-containing protein n=1 Tax=Mytilus galloprovincialis TaxID=29158 RepID=A0A8B6BYS0_MYTGA|nr:Hypothetical predicted protein [Mytilus galloprovincialis]